jgi:hypothetical protein
MCLDRTVRSSATLRLEFEVIMLSPRSRTVRHSLCILSLLSAALLSAQCSPPPRDPLNAVDSARADSVARSEWAETARYRQLLRATLTAKDKVFALEESGCEIQRVFRKLGGNEGDAALEQARLRAYRTKADSLAYERVDRELAFKEGRSLKDAECDSLRATWPALDTSHDRYSDSHP